MAFKKEQAPVKRGRISLLRVPLDIVPSEELSDTVCDLLLNQPSPDSENKKQGHDVILLSLWDLLRARRSGEYRDYVYHASMVVPISKSLVSGARFLTGKIPVRYMPFYFFIDLLSILESREFTVYLLGGKEKVLKRVENNIHQTFPRLRIVGRCKASFRKQDESAIVETIRKTDPHLLIVGGGIRGGELWIARNGAKLNRGLRIWCSDLFDVFAEKRGRPVQKVFNLGLEAFYYFFRNPLRFFRIFSYFRYKFLLLIYRIMNID